MAGRPVAERLAVCSWSLSPKDPADLIAQLKQIGIMKVQLALDPLRANPAWAGAQQRLAQGAGATISRAGDDDGPSRSRGRLDPTGTGFNPPQGDECRQACGMAGCGYRQDKQHEEAATDREQGGALHKDPSRRCTCWDDRTEKVSSILL